MEFFEIRTIEQFQLDTKYITARVKMVESFLVTICAHFVKQTHWVLEMNL